MQTTRTAQNLQPPLPFDGQSPAHTTKRGRKRKHDSHIVRETSAELFEQAKTKRNQAFSLILSLLTEFDFVEPVKNLTSRQIFDLLKARNIIRANAEIGYVRPRLTDLLNVECVTNPLDEDGIPFEKRIKGFPASYTWRITEKGHELLACLTILNGGVKL